MTKQVIVIVEGRHTASTIEQTVTSLDGVVDNLGAVVIDLPEAEANLGHVEAAVKLDGGNVNHCDGVLVRLCMREEMDDTVEEEERRESRNGNTEEGRGVFMVGKTNVCCLSGLLSQNV